MIIKSQEAHKYSRKGMIANYYQLKDFRGGTSYVLAEFTGEHGERTMDDRGRVYFIIEGEAKFVIDNETIIVGKESLVIIPPHSTFNFWPLSENLIVFVELGLVDLEKLPK